MKKGMVAGFLVGALWFQAFASPVDIMIGARGYGFGGAYAGIADDPSAAYWNPAALTQVQSISLMESNWIFQDVEGLNVNYVNLVLPISRVGTVSGSWLMEYAALTSGSPDEDGAVTISKNGFWNTLSLSVARMLWMEYSIFKRTSLGFTVNRFAFATENARESGLSIDIGLFTKLPWGLSMGAVGKNLLGDVGGASIDPEARIGLGWSRIFSDLHRVTIDIDGAYKMNRDYSDEATMEPAMHNMKYFGGLEYALLFEQWEIAVRGGGNGLLYNTTDSWGFAAGIGLAYLGYSFQYAFKGDTKPEAGLGYSHRADLILDFSNLRSK